MTTPEDQEMPPATEATAPAAGETAPATESPPPVDPAESAQAELARWKDLALRSQADFDNFRKRSARDITEIRRFAAADLLADLLPILDNFDLGLTAARNEAADSAIALGMAMVRRQLDDFLSTQGVKDIPAEGQTFDPAKHDAVATETHPSIPEGIVVRVARKGYFLHDRVLRPPSVIVSSGPAAEAPQPG